MPSSYKIKKILVIDDDPTQTKLFSSLLIEQGYEPVTSNDASEGLKLAMAQNFDLIMLDVMMPLINGFNLCRLLKSIDQKKNIPIVLITSRNELEDINIGREMGADAYLTKPVKMEELLKTINILESISDKKE